MFIIDLLLKDREVCILAASYIITMVVVETFREAVHKRIVKYQTDYKIKYQIKWSRLGMRDNHKKISGVIFVIWLRSIRQH